MPFIDQLQHWAQTMGTQTAVVVGEQRLTFAQLLHSATSSAVTPDPVEIIDEPNGAALAVKFCAAALSGKPAMVLDAKWSPDIRGQLRTAAREWGRQSTDSSGRDSVFLLGLSSGTSGLPKAFTRSSASWQASFARSAEYFALTAQCVTLAPGPLASSMNLYALGESLYAGSAFVALEHFSVVAALAAMQEHHVNRLVVVPTVLELLAVAGQRTGVSGRQLTSLVCAGSALSARTLSLARDWAPNATIHQYYGAAELGFVAASRQSSPRNAAAEEHVVGPAFPGVRVSIRNVRGLPVAQGVEGTIYVQSNYVCDGYAWGDDGLAFSTLAANAPWLAENGPASEQGSQDWFTVHDQGFLDAEERLHVLGRASDMIVTAGANVYPHAVEAALASALDATAAGENVTVVVTGRQDGLRGQRVVAGLHLGGGKDGGAGGSGFSRGTVGAGTAGGGTAAGNCATIANPASIDADAPMTSSSTAKLLAACRLGAAKLSVQHRPSQYFLLESLPLTGGGKISRAIFTQWLEKADPRAQRLH